MNVSGFSSRTCSVLSSAICPSNRDRQLTPTRQGNQNSITDVVPSPCFRRGCRADHQFHGVARRVLLLSSFSFFFVMTSVQRPTFEGVAVVSKRQPSSLNDDQVRVFRILTAGGSSALSRESPGPVAGYRSSREFRRQGPGTDVNLMQRLIEGTAAGAREPFTDSISAVVQINRRRNAAEVHVRRYVAGVVLDFLDGHRLVLLPTTSTWRAWCRRAKQFIARVPRRDDLGRRRSRARPALRPSCVATPHLFALGPACTCALPAVSD